MKYLFQAHFSEKVLFRIFDRYAADTSSRKQETSAAVKKNKNTILSIF